MEKFLVYNAVKCLHCEEFLISHHRHDFKMCKCINQTSVDGGNVYIRTGGVDMDLVERHTLYSDANFEIVRTVVRWGSRGVNGDQPLEFIPLNKLTDGHLGALLHYLPHSHNFRSLIELEIKYRKHKSDDKV